jgi:hypothetical protein
MNDTQRQTMDALKKANAQQQEDHPLLGVLVFWNSTAAAIDMCHAQADAHGIDQDLGWVRIDPRGAYLRAVRSTIKIGQPGTVDERRVEAVRLDNGATSGKIVHELERRTITKGAQRALTDRAVKHDGFCVGFDLKALARGVPAESCILADDPTQPEVAIVLEQYKRAVSSYEADDLTTATNRALARWGGLPLSTSGGRWFVPARYADKVAAWEQFMASIGCHTSTWRIHVSPANMAELETTARDGLEERLRRLTEELADYTSKDRTKLGTLEDRVSQFDEMRNTVELYERLLGQTMDELRGRLETAAGALAETVTGRRAERDAERARKQSARNVARKAERARAKAAPLSCTHAAASLVVEVLRQVVNDAEQPEGDRLAAERYVDETLATTTRATTIPDYLAGTTLPIPPEGAGAIVLADAMETAGCLAVQRGVPEVAEELAALRAQIVALFPAAA